MYTVLIMDSPPFKGFAASIKFMTFLFNYQCASNFNL